MIITFYLLSYQSCSCSLIKNGLDPLPDHRQDAPDRQGEGRAGFFHHGTQELP